MTLLKLFWAFFISNILGYGGGPATIPLVQQQVVDNYGWMSNGEFADLLAVSNTLPGPIATKIAAFIGFQEAGVSGLIIASFATIAPSAFILILLFRVINYFKGSPVVKGMTSFVQPVIAILMLILTKDFWLISLDSIGGLQSFIIAFISFVTIKHFKVHPALVILGVFLYGGIMGLLF